MRKPKAKFLCCFNKSLFLKLFTTNNEVSIDVQISSNNWPIKKSNVDITEIMNSGAANVRNIRRQKTIMKMIINRTPSQS